MVNRSSHKERQVVIGIRPVEFSNQKASLHAHGFDAKEDIPKYVFDECSSFVQGLKELPTTSVHEIWMYSEDGWFLLAQVLQTLGAVAETAALIYMLHKARKEKRKQEDLPIKFIITISRSANPEHPSGLERIYEDETEISVRLKLTRFGVTIRKSKKRKRSYKTH